MSGCVCTHNVRPNIASRHHDGSDFFDCQLDVILTVFNSCSSQDVILEPRRYHLRALTANGRLKVEWLAVCMLIMNLDLSLPCLGLTDKSNVWWEANMLGKFGRSAESLPCRRSGSCDEEKPFWINLSEPELRHVLRFRATRDWHQ